jgi:hypothetical protein
MIVLAFFLIFFFGMAIGWAVCSLMVQAKKGDNQ